MKWLIVVAVLAAAPALAGCQQVAAAMCEVVACPLGGVVVVPPVVVESKPSE